MFDINTISVTASLPYPPLKCEKENTLYASLLMIDMASAGGEMTAIYQYLYENWVLNEKMSLYAQLMLKIAKVEMHHLNMLGDLIQQLGGDPKCQTMANDKSTPWNGTFINYSKELNTMLCGNIMGERAAYNTYQTHANQIKDPFVSAVLRRIAEDEKVHYQLFNQMINKNYI